MKRFALALLLLLPIQIHSATVGGKVHSDGTEIQCDLPGEFHKKNIASKGLGCCVFRSADHAAHHQLIEALYGFPEWMVSKGIPGGGYPEKVDKLIPMICKDRGFPIPDYIQIEGPWSKIKDVLMLASKTGRYICITYSRSPTSRYGKGATIAHMVNMVNAGPGGHWVYLDNNFVTPPEQAYEWCSEQEAKWASESRGSVWAFIFLEPGPVPIPRFDDAPPVPRFTS